MLPTHYLCPTRFEDEDEKDQVILQHAATWAVQLVGWEWRKMFVRYNVLKSDTRPVINDVEEWMNDIWFWWFSNRIQLNNLLCCTITRIMNLSTSLVVGVGWEELSIFVGPTTKACVFSVAAIREVKPYVLKCPLVTLNTLLNIIYGSWKLARVSYIRYHAEYKYVYRTAL